MTVVHRKNDPVGEPPNRPPRKEALRPAPSKLNDQEREGIGEFLETRAAEGYKAALASIGYHATHDAAKALILGDGELRERYFAGYGLDQPTLLTGLGEMAADAEHKDRFRVHTFALNAFHGWSERTETDVNHGGEVSNPDVAAAIDRFTVTVRRLAERAESGGAVRDVDGGPAELPPGEPGG